MAPSSISHQLRRQQPFAHWNFSFAINCDYNYPNMLDFPQKSDIRNSRTRQGCFAPAMTSQPNRMGMVQWVVQLVLIKITANGPLFLDRTYSHRCIYICILCEFRGQRWCTNKNAWGGYIGTPRAHDYQPIGESKSTYCRVRDTPSSSRSNVIEFLFYPAHQCCYYHHHHHQHLASDSLKSTRFPAHIDQTTLPSSTCPIGNQRRNTLES